jgi:hypothetical protein
MKQSIYFLLAPMTRNLLPRPLDGKETSCPLRKCFKDGTNISRTTRRGRLRTLRKKQFEALQVWLRGVCLRAPYYESITGEQRIARLDLRFTTLSTLPSPQGFQCRMQLGFSTTRRPRGTRAPIGFQLRSGVPKRPSSWPRARTAA